MFNRYLKFCLFALASSAPSLIMANSHSLPEGCKGLNFEAGVDPLKAKNIYFGEIHDDQDCYSELTTCTKALSAGLEKSDIVGLFESVPSGAIVDCNEQQPMGSAFSACYGWDVSHEDFKAISLNLDKNSQYIQLYELTASHFEQCLTHNFSSEKIQKVLDYWISFLNNQIAIHSSKHEEKLAAYRNRHPSVEPINFHSQHVAQIDKIKMMTACLENIKKRVAQGIPFDEVLEVELYNEIREAYRLATEETTTNGSRTVGERNIALVKTNLAMSKTKAKIFSYAGYAHVKKNFLHKTEINALYNELDRYADENPYAVLTCNLKK